MQAHRQPPAAPPRSIPLPDRSAPTGGQPTAGSAGAAACLAGTPSFVTAARCLPSRAAAIISRGGVSAGRRTHGRPGASRCQTGEHAGGQTAGSTRSRVSIPRCNFTRRPARLTAGYSAPTTRIPWRAARIWRTLITGWGDAVTLLRETVARCERVLPPGDPLRQTVRESLTNIAGG